MCSVIISIWHLVKHILKSRVLLTFVLTFVFFYIFKWSVKHKTDVDWNILRIKKAKTIISIFNNSNIFVNNFRSEHNWHVSTKYFLFFPGNLHYQKKKRKQGKEKALKVSLDGSKKLIKSLWSRKTRKNYRK